MKKVFPIERNFTKNPERVYVSVKTGKVYQLSQDESKIDLDNPLTGLSLLLYKFVSENNSFKIYDLKDSLK